MITLIERDKIKNISSLFGGWDETLIWSCLQGRMGQAWADDAITPAAAQIITGDFCFFAGDPTSTQAKKLVGNIPADYARPWILMIPKDDSWHGIIEEVYKGKFEKQTRYAIKKEQDVFDKDILRGYINALPDEYRIAQIDESLYHLTQTEKWSWDFCSQFPSFADYQTHGLGFVVLYDGNPVCGASSYTYYDGGIEIEIGTVEVHRRKGLATACASKLILECLSRGLYPSWDAANRKSVALAEKLGYHFDREYVTYEITGFREDVSATTLTTERCKLSPLSESDFDEMAPLFADGEARRYLGGARPLADTFESLRSAINAPNQYPYAVHLRNTNEFIGYASIGPHHNPVDMEIGYIFLPQYWGNGYARETLGALLGFCKQELKLRRVVSETQTANLRSCRLLEKLGYTAESKIERFGAEQTIYVRMFPDDTMRTEHEMMDLIIGVAKADERIRAVSLEGSRANPAAPKDNYMDYDITYYVSDIVPFYNNPEWVTMKFGKPLIMQMPEAMRNPCGDGNFNYMMIYSDGVRIDLSFVFDKYVDDGEPSVTLLDKDNGNGFRPVMPLPNDKLWHIKPPDELFYYSCCNNFWWCLNNVAKGIARDELPYVMSMLNDVVRTELHDMIGWHIGAQHEFNLSVGKNGKYFRRYLSPELYSQYAATYSGSDYDDIWKAIYAMCDLFHTLALSVASHFGFTYRQNEEDGMREYLRMVKENVLCHP